MCIRDRGEEDMKFSDDSANAASYLRQALPLMMKYKLPPTPLNYALWYTYVSKKNALLNKALDDAIERHGTCPVEVSEELFMEYVSDVDETKEQDMLAFQTEMSDVVDGLSSSLVKTSEDSDVCVKALQLGVESVLSKNLDPKLKDDLHSMQDNADALSDSNEMFKASMLSAQEEIGALKAKLEESRELAIKDALTGLYNRRHFDSSYDDMTTLNHDGDVSLIMMDVDNFKSFNDTYGHVMGDQILKFIGRFLKRECDKNVVPFRLGGEEFAMLCPTTNLQAAHNMAELLRSKLAKTQLKHQKTGVDLPRLTASFGVAQKRADDVLTDIVERADEAMYKAKGSGRNQVIIEH